MNTKEAVWNYEYTDTFGGEVNYSWIKRGEVSASSEKSAVRKIKKLLNLNGVQTRNERQGDTLALYPIGTCTVLFIF